MARPLLPNHLWAVIKPILPSERPKPKGGRPRVPDRAALTGILFVLRSGLPWEMLPKEMGCGSGMTCWRRLREWQDAGVMGSPPPRPSGSTWASKRDRLAPRVLGQRVRGGQKGGEKTGPNPTDRGRPGSKRHVLTDGRGIPLTIRLTAANVHDSRVFEDLLDAVPPVRQRRGRPRYRPSKLHADKAYDTPRCRKALRRRRIKARIARRGVDSSEKLGRHRWVIEWTLAWFSRFRRLTIRYERRADIHQAFLSLAASLICWSYVRQGFC